MAKKIVTLFIRDNGINILIMDGRRVERWARGPLEEGLVVQGTIRDEAKVAERISEMLRVEKIKASRVIAGVSGVNSIYRLITLPEMPETLLNEAVKREARRVLPVALDELYLSHQSVPAVSRGEQRLFLAAYPRSMGDSLIRTVRQAGLDPYMMDLAPLALSRVPDEPRSIIISVRGDRADVIIVEDRLPQLIRVLSLPSEAKTFAERLPVINEELSRTVVFYNSSHVEKPLNPSVPLFVAGEAAEAPDTWAQLVGRLNFPVAVLPSPVEAPEGFPTNDFMVNVGLALKELTAERGDGNFSVINMNVLPEAYQPRRIPVSRVVVPAVILIAVGIVGYMGYMVIQSRSDTNKLRQQVTQSEQPLALQNKDIATLKAQVKQAQPLPAPVEAQIAQVRAVASVFQSTMTGLQTNRAKIDRDMKDTVVGKLPSSVTAAGRDLTLESVNHDGDVIVVTGTTTDEKFIFTYSRDLRGAGGIASVVITSIARVPPAEEGGADTFQFTLLLK